jgi:hypothetical protein
MVENKLPWKPDVWIQCDASWAFQAKPKADKVVTIATDSHCINYDIPRAYSDLFCNMHLTYSQRGDFYLPYCFDPTVHYPVLGAEKEYDVYFSGLLYKQRVDVAKALSARGMKIKFEIGKVYDEYREAYSKSRIGFSWSSLLDIPARVFEGMAMGLPMVINRVPDLANFFVEGDHYLGFDTVSEAVEKIEYLLKNPDKAREIADAGHRRVWDGDFTYDNRISMILDKLGLRSL